MRWRNTSSVGDMLDELEKPSMETRKEQSYVAFFYKINPGTLSFDKDKYLIPAPTLRRTRASYKSQYTMYLAYSDALFFFSFQGISLCEIVSTLRWSHPRPLMRIRL